MGFDFRRWARVLTACAFINIFMLPFDALAQSHVVSPAEMQKQIINTSQARQQNLDTVRQFLSTPTAEKALKSARMDPVQVKNAVGSLSDQDLAQLSARASKAQADFAAGNLSERDLLLIILGIAVLVLIIVAVR